MLAQLKIFLLQTPISHEINTVRVLNCSITFLLQKTLPVVSKQDLCFCILQKHLYVQEYVFYSYTNPYKRCKEPTQ